MSKTISKLTKKPDNSAKKAAKRAKFYLGKDKFVGDEPRWELEMSRAQLIQSYNWYNYNFSQKDIIPWIVEYMKAAGYNTSQIAAFKSFPDSKISFTVGSICKLINNGMKVPEESVTWMRGKIDALLAQSVRKDLKAIAEIRQNTLSIADRIKEKVSNMIGDFEVEVDSFISNGYQSEFKTYDYMKRNDVKSAQALKVAEYYKPLRDSIQEIISGKDDQLKEAYKNVSKQNLRAYYDFIDGIITNAESIAQVKKAIRRTRKPKEKSSTQLVSKMRYLKESSSFKIASIDPTRIIKSQMLLVFNTKNRKLGIYVASQHNELSVNGSTITGFDDMRSVSKTLRKPEDFLPAMLTTSKNVVNKTFADIKTTQSIMNGRINNDTILLRVFV